MRPKDNSTVVEGVVGELRERLRRGVLSPGDRLPPERVLAEELGVSRASIREGLQTLLSLGVLESRHGSGTVVAKNASRVLDRPFELLIGIDRPPLKDLYEARRVLEVGLARMAAERRTAEQLRHLEEQVHLLRDAADDPKRRTEPNVRFHRILAEMSGNVVLGRVMDSLMLAIQSAIEVTNSVAEDVQATVAVHAEIAKAIRCQDPMRAERAMHRHMDLALAEVDRWEKQTPGASEESA